MRLWYRLTDLNVDQIGPAIAGRLQGKPFTLALRTQVRAQDGRMLTGDEGLAYPGADPVMDAAGAVQVPAAPSGTQCLMRALTAVYGADDQGTQWAQVKSFLNHRRGRNSLQDYLTEHDLCWDEAQQAGLGMNNVGRTMLLLDYSGVDEIKKDNILLLVNHDLNRYDEVRNHLDKMAKRQQPTQLAIDDSTGYAEGMAGRSTYYGGEASDGHWWDYDVDSWTDGYTWTYDDGTVLYGDTDFDTEGYEYDEEQMMYFLESDEGYAYEDGSFVYYEADANADAAEDDVPIQNIDDADADDLHGDAYKGFRKGKGKGKPFRSFGKGKGKSKFRPFSAAPLARAKAKEKVLAKASPPHTRDSRVKASLITLLSMVAAIVHHRTTPPWTALGKAKVVAKVSASPRATARWQLDPQAVQQVCPWAFS